MGCSVRTAHPVHAISDLKAVSVADLNTNDHRWVLGYRSAGDGGGGLFRYNAGSSVADDAGLTIAPNTGAGRWERVWKRGCLDVKWFGASGAGSDTAANDQSAFAHAIAAANRLGASVYIPAGNYYVTGPFTITNGAVVIFGDTVGGTTIHHTESNTLFNHAANEFYAVRGFQHMKIVGNSGVSAKGIVLSNTFHAFCRDLLIRDYAGGVGIQLINTNSLWTEGTHIESVHIRNCAKCVEFAVSGGTNSFSETRIYHTSIVPEAANQTGIVIGDGCYVYAGVFDFKLFPSANSSTCVGMSLGSNASLGDTFLNIFIEFAAEATTAVGISTVASSNITCPGNVYPPIGDVRHSINALSSVFIGTNARYGDSRITGGEVANWNGSDNTAALGAVAVSDPSGGYSYGGYGFAHGNNIETPVAWGYAGAPSIFEVFKVGFQQRLSAGMCLMKVSPIGDLELTQNGQGVVVRSPNGTRYRISVNDAGMVVATAAP